MNHHEATVRTVRSVDRAIDALEAVARSPVPLTLAQLSETLEAPKSTTLNIARTLVRRRLLDFDGTSKTYRIGYILAGLASAVPQGGDLRSLAKPYLERLALDTREVVYLAVLEGNELVFIEKIDSSQPIRYIAHVGTRRPLHCTAGGKMSLAMQPDTYLQRYIAEVGLAKYTAHTLTTPSALRRNLEEIRRCGYAVSKGEFLEDLTGLSVPILRDGTQAPVAVLVVAGPSFRVRKRARGILALMKKTAAAVAEEASRFAVTVKKGAV
jgi:IclR family transcriptional regulator, KDG regulon repressor